MKLELGYIREQIIDEEAEEDVDEGEPVGELGKSEGKTEITNGEKGAGGKKRKVRVGRGLGVGELVERNESQKT